jgi:polar amino acid transport system substrate-binding protein
VFVKCDRGMLAIFVAFAIFAIPGCGDMTKKDSKPALSQLRVGIDISYPPMEYFEAGKPTGIDIEVAEALGKKLGVPVKIENIGFDSLITSLQSDKIDVIISGLKDTAQRQQRLNLIDYFQIEESILVKKGNPKKITSLATMCGKTAGQVSGTVTLTAVQEASKKCPGAPIKIRTFGSNSDVNLAIKAGQADVNLDDTVSLRYVARTSGGGNDFEAIAQPEFGKGYFGIATLKSKRAVTDAVTKAYKQILEDGSLAAIYKKYGNADSTPPNFLQNAGKD